MELSELQELRNDPKELITKLEDLIPEDDGGAAKWEPEEHPVMKVESRPKRVVQTPTGKKDADNKDTYTTDHLEVNRIPSSTNKQIVSWAVQMALGVPVEHDAFPEDEIEQTMFDMVVKTIKSNKMEYLDQEIERKKEVFLNVLEVWYSEPAPEGYWDGIADGSKFRMRCVILSPEDGDTIIPIWNQYKDLIGAGRKYQIKIDGEMVNKMDLFTNDRKTTYIEDKEGWREELSIPHLYQKMQCVLHQQPRRETQDVEPKLARREVIDSDNSDENEASGRRILAATGTMVGVGTRADTGKVFMMENGADLKYVEPKGSQASIEIERANLLKDIYDETSTPALSFDTSKGMGNMPGISIKLLFLPAMNKARSKQQGALGMAHQRRINFLKSAMAVINTKVKPALNMDITPRFSIFLPENEVEKYDNVIKLYAAGLISMRKAIEMLDIVDNVDEEMEAIEAEVAKRQAAQPITEQLTKTA